MNILQLCQKSPKVNLGAKILSKGNQQCIRDCYCCCLFCCFDAMPKKRHLGYRKKKTLIFICKVVCKSYQDDPQIMCRYQKKNGVWGQSLLVLCYSFIGTKVRLNLGKSCLWEKKKEWILCIISRFKGNSKKKINVYSIRKVNNANHSQTNINY